MSCNSNVREQFNAANKEIEKQFSVAARQLNLSQYFESDSTQNHSHQGNTEENSSEDSLMEERHRKSSSLPRPPRAHSLDRLSMKSDATGSVKSQTMPDITIKLSVGSLCSQCHRPLYEEEIMSGWSTEPSCMMTECPWCRLRTRPDISIEVVDRRTNLTRRFSHAFMSPMVLRKEIETLIGLGDEALMRSVTFIDNHPNQFWNLLYAFQRIGLKHNLDQLIPQSKILCSEESDIDSGKHSLDNTPPQVVIQLSWDSDHINDSMSYPPIYRVYQEYKKQKNERDLTIMKYQFEFMQTIVEAIKTNDCNAPLLKLLYEFDRHATGFVAADNTVDGSARRSCYREALFLLIAAVGQENIEIPLFDSHWYGALQNLPRHAAELRKPNDTVPSFRTYTLRQYFNVLPLLY